MNGVEESRLVPFDSRASDVAPAALATALWNAPEGPPLVGRQRSVAMLPELRQHEFHKRGGRGGSVTVSSSSSRAI
ncbi:unnamed protein product [Lampetra planeri]